jgi:hypothetical protein
VAIPHTYTLGWGTPRKEKEPHGWPDRQGWLPAEDKTLAAAGVSVPPVYATLPKEWLGQSLVKGPILPAGQSKAVPFYDEFMGLSWKTAVNHLDKRVDPKHRIKDLTDAEPWLYDRGATLYVTYLRRGGLEALTEAHLASQYYATQMMPDGKFRLLGNGKERDGKYGNQECLAMDYWFFGDERMLTASQHVAKLIDDWDPAYSTKRGFWTERQLGLLMLNAITAYELQGDPKMLERAKHFFDAAYDHQFNPPPGVPRNGCWVHNGRQHGQEADEAHQICSPWMSTLVLDAMLRYYIITADPRVPQSIEALADFVVRHGTYRKRPEPGEPREMTYPYYLIGSGPLGNLEADLWGDRMHALDVSMILASADYFTRKAGKAKPEYRKLLSELLQTAQWTFEKTYRPNGPNEGIPIFGVSPPRKFNWWFRTTASLDWFMSQAGGPNK